jgi:hypothetical protein
MGTLYAQAWEFFQRNCCYQAIALKTQLNEYGGDYSTTIQTGARTTLLTKRF